MDWVKLALGIISVAQALLRNVQSSRDFTAGEEHQILASSKETMRLTAQGKAIMEKIDAMSDDDVGGLLDDLGKPDSGTK